MNETIVTVLTLLPVAGGIIVAGLGDHKKLARRFALGVSLAALAIAVWMWSRFDPSTTGFQFHSRHLWIPTLGIEYRVGVDGLGLLMVLLAAVVTPMAILASWNITEANNGTSADSSGTSGFGSGNSHLYFALVLFLQAGLFGTFTALNFFHWFLFWELSLIPAFFLVRLWGGPRRSAAATQFFVYTMFGSIAMLLSFLAIYLATDRVSDFSALADLARDGKLKHILEANLGWHHLTTKRLAAVIFAGAFLGLAVKVPLMPFHTWLPSTYTEAPTGTTMLLTGVMSKMGVYGFLRVLLPIFPEQIQWLRTPLLILAVITIVFSASAAFAQKDLKRMLAYSSINHLGYCLLAIFAVATAGSTVNDPATQRAAALNGVFLQVFNHGITGATLFWFVAFLEKRSGGLRRIDEFGGLRKVAPVFCGLMGIALFSSLGLPGLNGFVGEFLIFKGAFPLATCSTSIAVIGLLVTAIFLLTILQRVFNGPLNERWSKLPDLTAGERTLIAIPLALMFLLGVYPQLVLGVINNTVVQLVEQLRF
jgi:NADH-quinone oxidoreductase subunit M